MAKKKGKKGGKKVGTVSRGKKDSPLMFGLGLLVGGLGTVLIDAKLLHTWNGKLKGGGEVLLGAAGVWKMKNPMLKGISAGMLTFGGIRLVTSLTGMTISGIGCREAVNGFAQVQAIGRGGVKAFPQPAQVGANRRERISTLAAGGM